MTGYVRLCVVCARLSLSVSAYIIHSLQLDCVPDPFEDAYGGIADMFWKLDRQGMRIVCLNVLFSFLLHCFKPMK